MTKAERAQYMRGYRKTVEPLKERESRNEGFRAGVAACVKLVKDRGDFQLAMRLERIGNHESFETTQRRAVIASMHPRNGST